MQTAKALELFLGMIIEEANKVTAERGSKKVEAYHLYVVNVTSLCCFLMSIVLARCSKHAVENVDMLDFLKEIVEAVPDPSAGGTIDVNAEPQEKEKKRRGKGKRAEGGPSAPRKRRRKAENKEEEEEEEPEQDGDAYDNSNGNGRHNADDEDWEG